MTWQLLQTGGARVQQVPEALAPAIFDSSGLEPTDWVVAATILVCGIVLSMLVRRAVLGILRRGTTVESMSERLVGRFTQIVILILALSYALTVLDVRIGPLLGALGIGGIAVALALQETLRNLFAGVILHAQRPLRLGEEVITGDIQGTVVDITSRAVTIRSNSGRTMFIPNSLVLDREIVNLVREGVRRTTLEVSVAYGTDLDRALEVIRSATAGAEGVLGDPPVRVLGSEFADSAINFDIDFWHGPAEATRRQTASNVVVAVHQALGDAGITIPFPQRTVWPGENSATEPSPETGTEPERRRWKTTFAGLAAIRPGSGE